MFKAGRFTAAAMLVVTGTLLLLDQLSDIHLFSAVAGWWPLILIALGLEYLILNFVNYNNRREIKLDFGGLLFAVIVSAIVVGASQTGSFSFDWLKNWQFSFPGETGTKFVEMPTDIPVADGTQKVMIVNPYGDAAIQSGDVEQIHVQPTVWVNTTDQEQARKIADNAKVVYSEGSTLQVETQGQEYGGGLFGPRKPRINLEITLPQNKKVDVEIRLTNGNVDASKLSVRERFDVQSSNGSLRFADIVGQVHARTTNGSIHAESIAGHAQLQTTNGPITAQNIQGNLILETTNGSLQAGTVSGQLSARSTNSSIAIDEVRGGVQAETTNGSVKGKTHTVGGDWNIRTSNGKITLQIPENGDYRVQGQTTNGSIDTDLPFNAGKQFVEGSVGKGTYLISLSTKHAGISVHKVD